MIYSTHNWTPISQTRNAIQRAHEPVQIYFSTQLADWMGCRSFFDIGANVGSFSVAMAQLSKIERIHAFEPMPTLHIELAENVRNNCPFGKVILHQMAISDKTGSVEFAVLGNYSGANGVADTLIHDHAGIDRKIIVEASTIDDVLQDAEVLPDGPCFIKIDVEGHEVSVLKGAFSLLKNVCVLQIESFETDDGKNEIDAILTSCGYCRFWQIGPDRYYARSDLCPSSEQLLGVVSQAHSAMIEDFKQITHTYSERNEGAIIRRFGPVEISLFDPLSRWLRRVVRR